MHDFAGYRPGSLAGVVGLHAASYARGWGFGLDFEAPSDVDQWQGGVREQLHVRPARGRA